MREIKESALPEGFLERMEGLLGKEYPEFLESFQKECTVGLRLNPLKWAEEQTCSPGCAEENREDGESEEKLQALFELRKIPWAREGYYYKEDKRPGKHPFHEAGVYYIQEPSAMAAVELLDPKPGERILDLCGAPGGKSTQIAGRMRQAGLLVSNEIHPARAKILSRNIERMGVGNAVVTNEDSQTLLEHFPEFFDRILVDAPCSGEGMFRKDQQARQEWSIDNIRLCVSRQARILDHAAGMLKAGGRLVYSTCTFSPEENEGSIQGFLERHRDFALEDMGIPDGFSSFGHGQPAWIGAGREELERTFRIWPHKTDGEGHFLAVLKKKFPESGTTQSEREKPESIRKAERKDGKKDGKTSEAWAAWQEFAENELIPIAVGSPGREEGPSEKTIWDTGYPKMFGDQLYLVPAGMIKTEGLKVLRPGLHLGELKKNRFEPSHSLALYLKKEQVRQWVSLESDGTLVRSYLGGEAIDGSCPMKVHTPPLGKGWILILADGFSMGWAKLSGNMLKNHYPKGLRKY